MSAHTSISQPDRLTISHRAVDGGSVVGSDPDSSAGDRGRSSSDSLPEEERQDGEKAFESEHCG